MRKKTHIMGSFGIIVAMSLSLTSPLTTFATVSKSLETTIITTEKVAVEEKAAASTTTRVIAKATSKNALSSKTEAVAGASVELVSVGGKGEVVVATTTTDELGATQGDLNAGSYKVRLSKIGFKTAELPFSVIEGTPEMDLGSIEMVALGKLQGTVTTSIKNADGSKTTVKLADAVVTISQGGKEITTVKTDKNGYYLVEGLAEGSYDIDISKTGMKRVTTTTTTKDGEVTTYDADLLPQTGTIKATVERYVKTKAGELVKKDTPIIDADVVVSDEKGTTLITSAKSDIKSEATVEEIVVGTYSIQAKKAGFESVIPSVISVVDSMVTSPVLKLIELGAKIMNMVFDDTNGDGKQSEQELGLEGTTVDLLDKDGAIISTTQTRKDGSYSFDLEPGDYTIRVKAPLGYTFTTNEPQKITIAEGTVQGKTNGHGLKIAQAVGGSTFYDVYVSVLPVSSPAPAPTPTHSVADTQKEALPLEGPTDNEDEATNEGDQATSPYQGGGGTTNEGEPSVQYEFESNESSLTHPASLPDTGADVEWHQI